MTNTNNWKQVLSWDQSTLPFSFGDNPGFVTLKHLEYLDRLRESGVTNMFGAIPYILASYPELDEEQAKNFLQYWMKTFLERHKE